MKALIHAEFLRLKPLTIRCLGLNLLILLLVGERLPAFLLSGQGLFIVTIIYAVAATLTGIHQGSLLNQPNQRAFLFHRPIAPVAICNGVVAAAMASFTLAFVLPLVVIVGGALWWFQSVTLGHLNVFFDITVLCFCCYLAGLLKHQTQILVGALIVLLPLFMVFVGIGSIALMLLCLALFMLNRRMFSASETRKIDSLSQAVLLSMPLQLVCMLVLSFAFALIYQLSINLFDDKHKGDWMTYWSDGSYQQISRVPREQRVQLLLNRDIAQNPDMSAQLLPNFVYQYPFNNAHEITYFKGNAVLPTDDKRDTLALNNNQLTVSSTFAITLKAGGDKISSIDVFYDSAETLIAIVYQPQILSENGLPFAQIIEIDAHGKTLIDRIIEFESGWPLTYQLRHFIMSPLLAGLNTLLVEQNPNRFANGFQPQKPVLWLMILVCLMSLWLTHRLVDKLAMTKKERLCWLAINTLTGVIGLLTLLLIYRPFKNTTPEVQNST
ncbi:MAG: hypothetical protein HRT35_11280 [Algicola sp.]|nr:hypothetical protein [Algicola sp.]